MSAKWDAYYTTAEETGSPPPWESSEPFAPLQRIIEVLSLGHDMKVIELGSGASATACHLAALGFAVTAVDISGPALERARRLPHAEKVNWVLCDILSPGDSSIADSTYELLFDMQCFHVLREIDEKRAVEFIKDCLIPDRGVAVVVVGASISDDGEEEAATGKPGPPRIKRKDFLRAFLGTELTVESCELDAFNPTPSYGSSPPPCWVAVLKRRTMSKQMGSNREDDEEKRQRLDIAQGLGC